MTREVLVPVSLGPLQELQIILHLALHEGLDRNRLLDLVLCEDICGIVSEGSTEGAQNGSGKGVLCNILKFCRYAYSVFALNLTLDMGTSSVG
jgi:hypothetical protein